MILFIANISNIKHITKSLEGSYQINCTFQYVSERLHLSRTTSGPFNKARQKCKSVTAVTRKTTLKHVCFGCILCMQAIMTLMHTRWTLEQVKHTAAHLDFQFMAERKILSFCRYW